MARLLRSTEVSESKLMVTGTVVSEPSTMPPISGLKSSSQAHITVAAITAAVRYMVCMNLSFIVLLQEMVFLFFYQYRNICP